MPTKIVITPPDDFGYGAGKVRAKNPALANMPNYESGGFSDLIDVINPMHHIPVVSTAYKSATGDGISAFPRILGGALFGGVIGLVVGIANAIVEQKNGKDIGDTILASLSGEDEISKDFQQEISEDYGGKGKGNAKNEYLAYNFENINAATPENNIYA